MVNEKLESWQSFDEGTHMLKIGLTGGIGSGKSTVAELLETSGIPMIRADRLARELINENKEIREELIAAFGPEIYDENGLLRRKVVADLVFKDPSHRRKINEIVHPYVLKSQQQEMNRILSKCDVTMVGVEAALIFEAGAESQFDVIVVVSAPLADVLQRLGKRDQLTRDEILNRIESQMPIEEKEKRADYVIRNDGPIEELREAVARLMIWLKEKGRMINSRERGVAPESS
ncbi:MAG: dephospho-CoA kinase [candidate division KSB1 bacterium]|jgi:dephospho-CoA kinase|nr:dephospho-CoA kinase [candidate division KSB1 bacterium]